MSNEQMSIFDQMANEKKPEFNKEGELTDLKSMVDGLQAAERDLSILEEKMEEAKGRIKLIGGSLIPDHLKKTGLSELRLDDGRKITIKSDIQVSIKDKTEFEKYLVANGAASNIKFNLSMKKLKEEERKEIFDKLGSLGVEYTADNSVHHQTAKKYIKDILGTEMSEEQYIRAIQDKIVVPESDITHFANVIRLNKTKIK